MRTMWRLLTVASAIALCGCSDVSVPNARSTTGRPPQVAEVPSPEETVRGAEDPPIITLNYSTRFNERRLSRNEPLPARSMVPTVNLDAVPVSSALQAVLTGTDISLSWDAAAFDDRLVSIANVSGPLPSVVEKICAAAKIFCTYRNGLLEMKDKETFIIDLPFMPSKNSSSSSSSSSSSNSSSSASTVGASSYSSAASNTMADAVSALAGDKARIDVHGGNLIYTTDVEGQERVREYLDQLRHGRPLIVMQLYIWEVTLNKENGTGINWSNLKFDKIGGKMQNLLITGSSAFTGLTSPGVSLGAKLSGHVDADTVLQFLSTQGQVQTISNPQLTFISGSSADFRVGGKQRYISQVGQVTSSVSTSSSTLGTNTVSTDSIDTGLSVGVNGSFENGVISAVLDVSLQDVVSLNPTSTEQGVTIDLPETTERKVMTTLRVRPGDNLVLAGLVSSRDDNNREHIPLPFGAHLTTQEDDKLKNSELVMLVKPSVVVFSDTTPEQGGTLGTGRPSKAMSGPVSPAPLLIDKDGAKPMPPMAVPRAQVSSQVLSPASVAVVREPKRTAAQQQPVSLTARTNASAGQGGVVNSRLLQSGFDQAYDDPKSQSQGSGQ